MATPSARTASTPASRCPSSRRVQALDAPAWGYVLFGLALFNGWPHCYVAAHPRSQFIGPCSALQRHAADRARSPTAHTPAAGRRGHQDGGGRVLCHRDLWLHRWGQKGALRSTQIGAELAGKLARGAAGGMCRALPAACWCASSAASPRLCLAPALTCRLPMLPCVQARATCGKTWR